MKKQIMLPAILAALVLCTGYDTVPKTQVYPENPGEPDPSLTFQEVRTASDRIVIALFTSDIVDLEGVDISDPSQWKLGRKPVLSLH